MENKIEMLEEMLELDEGTLTPETVLADVEEWDSLAALSLIVLMSDKYGKKIGAQQIKAFVTVKDVLDYMC